MVRLELPRALRVLPAATLTWLAACSNGGSGAATVSLSLSARSAPLPAATAPAGSGPAAVVVAAGDSTVIALGNDTLILRSLAVVLRKIELKRLETSSCDSIATNGDCEEFESGPVLATFPLGSTNTAAAVTVSAPAGQYDKLEFEIHKTDSTGDAAFVAANPGFKNISIRVTGTFSKAGSRSDFTFTSDLDASEELGFNPPLAVVDGTPANLTVRLDVATWFANGGALIDPASANVGGPNEGVVQNNIKNSIDAFEDDNRDGRDDHHEGS
ncbi:MAG TPA: hypothetical protein VL563_11365 [Gemmatimonadales bacterium]|jgi:hypothetical protein|nr:hypothetical protein [Gemmatimonadales bacterium]